MMNRTSFDVNDSAQPLDEMLSIKLLVLEDEEQGCLQPFAHYWSSCANEKQRHAFTIWYRERYLPVWRLLHPQETEQYECGKNALYQHLKNRWSNS